MAWDFYGRAEPLHDLRRIVNAGRWFFCRIEGRRRIGKTTLLVHLTENAPGLNARMVYMQVPDSDERDVAATFRTRLSESEIDEVRGEAEGVVNFATMARAVGRLCERGYIVILDEFQYFTRASLRSFNSHLQAEVDRLRNANLTRGGLFALGSIQSEMNALLDDKAAPLYGRVTDQLPLHHWDFEDLLNVWRSQGCSDARNWLTLWSFFEGVPKFYHDAYVQELYGVDHAQFARELLSRMFVRSSSPLSEEADTWFLRELRGRAVSILHYLSERAGASNGDLVAALNDESDKTPLNTHLSRLVSGYRMVDKLNPVFSDAKNRNARYYIADNFLQAWLAVAKPARETAKLRPLARALDIAIPKLETLEGFAFEKLIRNLHVEASRKGKGDIELSEVMLGYWNRPRDVARSIEIDLVALDQQSKQIRFGCSKRSAAAHDAATFERHIAAFLNAREHRFLASWKIEKVWFSPTFDDGNRTRGQALGYRCQDLNDFAAMFG